MAPLERFFSTRSTLQDDVEDETDYEPEDVLMEGDDLWVDVGPSHFHSSPSSPKSKKVHFRETVTIVRIASKKTLPASIKYTLWYQKKDFIRFRDSCRQIMDRNSPLRPIHIAPNNSNYSSSISSSSGAMNGNSSDEEKDECCMRGLEKFSRAGTLRYMERYNTMMNDFCLVRMTRASHDEVARILTGHSTVTRLEALERARKDEHDALLYQMTSVNISSDSALISNHLPKVRSLWNQPPPVTSTRGTDTKATKATFVISSTSARARQMRQQRLSGSRP